ncbi:MAG: LysR substrate-binding domain-containing protein, partial [Kiloniellales bacterium]|nr:LysR substrate-binding domain-containing protein [Kiloniellales bacterium]
KRILLGLDEISKIADDIRTMKEARLKIVAQPYVAHALVPDAFVDFHARYPQVRFSLEIRSRGDVAPWIAGQQFDLGIAALPIDAPAVRSEPFASVSVAAILPKGHPPGREAGTRRGGHRWGAVHRAQAIHAAP